MEQSVRLGKLNISGSFASFWNILLASYIKSALLLRSYVTVIAVYLFYSVMKYILKANVVVLYHRSQFLFA